jgi:hypothetical protein
VAEKELEMIKAQKRANIEEQNKIQTEIKE